MSHSKRTIRPVAAQSNDEVIATVTRKPRILMAGEFSAGKTRLISGLIGEDILPSNVTATALPPVWLVGGAKGLAAVDLDGNFREIDSLADVSVEDTQYCVISNPAKILEDIDIIDTPGSSDPNIPAEHWERMLTFADHAIWCTNATQAWRQSEKSVWNEMPEHLSGSATVLITHADRMPDQRTADRVLRRVQREAQDYFQHFMMASLIKSDDVDSVVEHIRQLRTNEIVLNGVSNSHVDEYARVQGEKSKEQQTTSVTAGQHIMPKRVKPRSKTEADATDVTTPVSAAVIVLEPATKKEAVSQEPTSVRLLWQGILKGADTTDAAAVMERVGWFLSCLEDHGVFSNNDINPLSESSTNNNNNDDDDDDLIMSNIRKNGLLP